MCTAHTLWLLLLLQEKEALSDRREFLRFAATGCERFDLNRSAWSLESEPTQIGGLIYW
jgi:hypothetical protein